MDNNLLYGLKGCMLLGSASLVTGLAAYLLPLSRSTAKHDFGTLTNLLAPYVDKLEQVLGFYPEAASTHAQILQHLHTFTHCFHQPPSHANTRDLVKCQRRLFRKLDDVTLTLSETTALDEIYQTTDDLKQAVTDICLAVDK